ncbi:MAG: hypothetical protein HY654_05985 [Acidobacteria bacterium]|nr:hypothetical protein [Acidobacteriota bacterium]
MSLSGLLPQLLYLLGIGFLIANLRIAIDFVQYLKRRSSAILTWPSRRPRYHGLLLGLGVVLGVLVFVKLVIQERPPIQVFGEGMMFLYYGYALPLAQRIGRGFYTDGIWAESGFIPYHHIGGVSWREGDEITLVLISRLKQLARRLVVPAGHYAEARRLLRDKIAAHDIHFTGTGLDLGLGDERDQV